MIYKDKAIELLNEMRYVNPENYVDNNGLWVAIYSITEEDAKACALKSVEVMIRTLKSQNEEDYDLSDNRVHVYDKIIKYWEQVYIELKKL
jgi:hypothetical protein